MNQEIAEPLAENMTVTSHLPHTVFKVFIDETPGDFVKREGSQHTPDHRVVLDPNLVDRDGRVLPKRFGPSNTPHKQTVRQTRERHVEFPPGKSVKLPIRFLPQVMLVTCGICKGAPGNLGGRASLECLRDPEHRPHVAISGGVLTADPTQIEIDVLKGIPLDGVFASELEELQKQAKMSVSELVAYGKQRGYIR